VPSSFLSGLLAGYGIAIPVGPVAILIVEIGVRRGLVVAAAAGLGAATADGLYATLAVLAGSRIVALLEPIAPALRIVAVIVLVVIAVRGFVAALVYRRSGVPGRSELPADPGRTYVRFLAITLLNPTTVLYFTSLILGRPELGGSPAEQAAFVVGAVLASTSWQLLLAAVGALLHRRLPWRLQFGLSLLGNVTILVFAAVIARSL
jgi:arginine exporter protein ArgO